METVGVFNCSRSLWIARRVRMADSHWTRLVGLLATPPERFLPGDGLWIRPCHGVHTLGMQYALDLIYLDAGNQVVELIERARPWRFFPVNRRAASVLELPPWTLSSGLVVRGDQLSRRLAPIETAPAG